LPLLAASFPSIHRARRQGTGRMGTDVLRKPRHVVLDIQEHWKFDRLLGEGSQSEVWAATHQSCNAVAAVRLLQNSDDAMRELNIYRHLCKFIPHPHVLGIRFGYIDE
jgi:hypothetical protein